MTAEIALTRRESDNFSSELLGDGWVSWNLKDGERFNAFLEPLMVRKEPEQTKGMKCGRLRMVPGIQHSNLGHNVHGAVTLSLIDIGIFAIPGQYGLLGPGYSVTLDLQTQFIGAGRIDEPLDVVVEVVRETGRLLFLRGLVVQGTDDSHLVASFTGTVRKPSPPRG